VLIINKKVLEMLRKYRNNIYVVDKYCSDMSCLSPESMIALAEGLLLILMESKIN